MTLDQSLYSVYLFLYVNVLFGVESQGSKSEGRREVKQRRRIVSKYKMVYYQDQCFIEKHSQLAHVMGHLLRGSIEPLYL